MNKKGDLWISAALYTVLGVILVTLILSVGLPFVKKIQTRNTLLQTKNIMFDLDSVIRSVYNEGYGSRRPLFIEINDGNFFIYDKDTLEAEDAKKNRILWTLISDDNLGIEPDLGFAIKEGNLNIESESLGQGYKIKLYLDYEDINIDSQLSSELLSGKYNIIVQHVLSDSGSIIEIRE